LAVAAACFAGVAVVAAASGHPSHGFVVIISNIPQFLEIGLQRIHAGVVTDTFPAGKAAAIMDLFAFQFI